MINVTDAAIMTSYLTAWTNTHNALARKMKDRNGALKGAIPMETVEVVIKLPKDEYDYIQLYGSIKPFSGNYIAKQIVNGTVLPKGHTDLIDRQDLINAIEQKAKRLENLDTINGLCGAVSLAYEAEIVIEADKEVEG